tara:strand:+ start:43 stop:237 length:195 start_codon:yes stop_codon:yes gene_type:complete
MAKSKKNYNKIINQIQKLREKNNINWMGVLKIAFKYAPKETERAVTKINLGDKRISKLAKKLTK